MKPAWRRTLMRLMLAVVGAAGLALGLNGCFGAPGYQGAKSAHFDGQEFYNTPRLTLPGLRKMLRWQLSGKSIPWPADGVEKAQAKPDALAPKGMIRATFVNHATVLLQVGELNVLTDPVWSERVGPLSWLGPKRHRSPGIAFEDLPRIDAVLISHSHYDHCDAPTLRRLQQVFHPKIFAGLGTAAMLAEHGIDNVTDMDWWQTAILLSPSGQRFEVKFGPAQHWSNRSMSDVNTVLWGSFGVQGGGASVYFAGDTGWGPHFDAIRAAWGAPDLALLPIGAYEPRWFMHPQHMGPDQAVEAHRALGARRSMAIHWLTFDQSDEGQYQPAGELGLALGAAHIPPDNFLALENGEVMDVALEGSALAR